MHYPDYMNDEDIMKFEYEYNRWIDLQNPNSLETINQQLKTVAQKQQEKMVDQNSPFCYNTCIVNKTEQKMAIKRFKQNQRFRVIVGDACFYATARQVRSGIGDFSKCNAAVQKALDALEFYRSGTGVESACTGHAGTWEGLQVQLNVA